MCLDKLWNVKKLPKNIVCWKIMRPRSGGRLDGQHYGNRYYRGQTYVDKKRGQIWIRRWGPAEGRKYPKYPMGFHAYATKQAAKANCWGNQIVVRVSLGRIHSVGMQARRLVYVGKVMHIYKKGA